MQSKIEKPYVIYLAELIYKNIAAIKKMICTYTSCPVAYTLDIAITEEGKTIVVEAHDFYSCGFYGFSAHSQIPCMLSQWFYEAVRKKIGVQDEKGI